MNLAVIIGYVLAQLLVAAIVSRRIRTEDDYLVAGRKLGYPLAIFTIFATWFGAETCIGAAGRIYEEGLSGGSADPFGYVLCLVVMGLVFARPLWRLKLTTVADLFRRRYSPGVERLTVILIAPTSMLWAAAQIRAFGQVLAASSEVELSATITLAAAVVILYTLMGGLLADAWTDMIQGITLLAGLLVLAGLMLHDSGTAPFAAIEAERLQLFGGPEASWLDVLENWSIPLCGSVLAAELVARVIAARSPQVAQRSSLLAGTIYIAVGIIPVSIGLTGPTLLGEIADPEQILPLTAQHYMPDALYLIFAGAMVGAILSTVDSALLVCGSLVSHNLVVPSMPNISERGKVRAARIAVALSGVAAYTMALHAEGVYALVEEASAFGSAGYFTVMVFALFSRFGGPASAAASLLLGMAAWIWGAYIAEIDHPYLVSLLAAALSYIGTAIVAPGADAADRNTEGVESLNA